MKKIALIFFNLLLIIVAYAQEEYLYLDFETSKWKNYIYFDTTSQNLWMVGKPSKKLFNTGYRSEHSIITDSAKAYPANNNSVFFLKSKLVIKPHYLTLRFKFKINSDTLKDFFKLHVSFDKGVKWTPLLEDSIPKEIRFQFDNDFGGTHKPQTISGNLSDWFEIYYDLADYYRNLKIETDTIIFKFSFLSDSINSFKEGLIIDNIILSQYWESVMDAKKSQIQTYPNPCSNRLFINEAIYDDVNFDINIFNSKGIIIRNSEKINISNGINIQNLPAGFYHLIISNKNTRYFTTFQKVN